MARALSKASTGQLIFTTAAALLLMQACSHTKPKDDSAPRTPASALQQPPFVPGSHSHAQHGQDQQQQRSGVGPPARQGAHGGGAPSHGSAPFIPGSGGGQQQGGYSEAPFIPGSGSSGRPSVGPPRRTSQGDSGGWGSSGAREPIRAHCDPGVDKRHLDPKDPSSPTLFALLAQGTGPQSMLPPDGNVGRLYANPISRDQAMLKQHFGQRARSSLFNHAALGPSVYSAILKYLNNESLAQSPQQNMRHPFAFPNAPVIAPLPTRSPMDMAGSRLAFYVLALSRLKGDADCIDSVQRNWGSRLLEDLAKEIPELKASLQGFSAEVQAYISDSRRQLNSAALQARQDNYSGLATEHGSIRTRYEQLKREFERDESAHNRQLAQFYREQSMRLNRLRCRAPGIERGQDGELSTRLQDFQSALEQSLNHCLSEIDSRRSRFEERSERVPAGSSSHQDAQRMLAQLNAQAAELEGFGQNANQEISRLREHQNSIDSRKAELKSVEQSLTLHGQALQSNAEAYLSYDYLNE